MTQEKHVKNKTVRVNRGTGFLKFANKWHRLLRGPVARSKSREGTLPLT